MFTYVVDDEVYQRLLDQAARLAGIRACSPLIPSHGVSFTVPIEKASGERFLVDGVLLSRSMAGEEDEDE